MESSAAPESCDLETSPRLLRDLCSAYQAVPYIKHLRLFFVLFSKEAEMIKGRIFLGYDTFLLIYNNYLMFSAVIVIIFR